ncbi:hypothetical protein [Methylomonas sp. MgM2]
MRLIYSIIIGLSSLLSANGNAASNDQFEPGDTVLTNCRQIYTKGTVIAKVDDGYTIHFPKKSGPINCPPFRWHSEFVLPFQSVPEYHLQFFGGFKRDLVFRVGEPVTLQFEADKRIIKNKSIVNIEAKITDISSNGAIAVELLSNDPESAAMFWKMVGNNYVDLRHDALEAERDKR